MADSRVAERHLAEHAALLEDVRAGDLAAAVGDLAEAVIAAMRAGGKLVLFGNGGSAADAQHVAAEFTGRFLRERAPLPALALTTDSSSLTAVGNDYAFADVFVRPLLGLGRRGDVVLGISTSGSSDNVVRALAAARECGMVTAGLTGATPHAMEAVCDHLLAVPSQSTPRIQELHILLSHILCDLVEAALAGEA